jgi:hypothetical protein
MTIAKGFKKINGAKSGGTWLAGTKRKWVGHTTEGYSSNPEGAAARHPWPPHCWVTLPSHPYAPRQKLQIIDFDRSAYALAHPAGTPETNRAGAIQVEVEGFARETHLWSKNDLNWLADEVVGPMCQAAGVDPSHYLATAGAGDGISPPLASKASPLRVPGGWGGYYQLGGLSCHQHANDNDHWDQGKIDLAYIAARLGGGTVAPPKPPPPPPPERLDDKLRFWKPTQTRTLAYKANNLMRGNDVSEFQFCANLCMDSQRQWTGVDGYYGRDSARLCRDLQLLYNRRYAPGGQAISVDGYAGGQSRHAVVVILNSKGLW